MGVATINVHYYFNLMVPGCTFEDANTRLASRVGAYLHTVDGGYTAYLYGAGASLTAFTSRSTI